MIIADPRFMWSPSLDLLHERTVQASAAEAGFARWLDKVGDT